MNAVRTIRSVELEITGTCDLQCSHCCTTSGPTVSSGLMSRDTWAQVITDIADLGIKTVQMIGGEPTLSPHLTYYVQHATDLGLKVEIFSNLAHIRPAIWQLLDHPNVSLATSYYSDQAQQHEQITNGKGSHPRTRANIIKALRRGVPLRIGLVEVIPGQRVAEAELRALGITRIRVDRARNIGRAAGASIPTVDELCGHCFRNRVSIDPDGNVSGCILSRFLEAGNVREQPLAEILHSALWSDITATIPTPRADACPPADSDDCNPASTPACPPAYDDDDFASAPALEATA